jgi:hypothetical protein
MSPWWLLIIVPLLIALLAGISLGVLVLLLQYSSDRSRQNDGNDDAAAADDLDLSDIWIGSPERFPQTGKLAMSTKLAGGFVRWHNPKYYWRGAEFWRTFEDSQRKWDNRERFAGEGRNCGHYFALTKVGATAEAAFYSMDTNVNRLLSADFESDSVLDLTYEENLLAIAKLALSNMDKISDRHFFVTILSWLTDDSQGGIPFTDFIGHWASRNGYEGLLFFGARALAQNDYLKQYIDTGADDGMMGSVIYSYLKDMRKKNDLKNLVMFSGARLTSLIKTSRLDPDPPDINPYYGKSESEIDALVEFKADYQEAQRNTGFYLHQPFTIE